MPDLILAPESTDAGALERLFLLETADPDQGIYSEPDSLTAMRWMKQVIDNRLAAPSKSRFGEPRDAASETDIIAVGKQFAGFGDYPDLSSRSKRSCIASCTLAACRISEAPSTPRSSRTRSQRRRSRPRRCRPAY